MDADGSPAELLSPVEAEWPPELRLPPPPRKQPPPPPPLPPPPPTEPAADTSPPRPPPAGIDDSQFLGSIMEAAAVHGDPPPPQVPPEATTEAPVVVKRKRGRPPKNRDGAVVPAAAAAAKPARRREDKEEVVCFICFDGGDLVVCDRRGCPKVYHPACIKRDESFFQSRGKWDCGWHICSSCEKAVHFMCYTCTYSLCKGCIKQGKFFSVRGTKGFCETCFGTIMLIESKDEDDAKVGVDFDDQNSWEYLFKLYWLDLKGKLSLTLAELISAKSQWNVRSTYVKKEKEESSDELYDANNDRDASSDSSSGKQKRTKLSSKRRGRKRQSVNSDCGIAAKKADLLIKNAEILPKKVPYDGMTLLEDTKWASPELLEFVGHMRDGDRSFISQFDIQALLLEYIKRNDLRDPRRKSQIICDARLNNLFGKPRVGHFEMLKLLEMHFLVKETSTVNNGGEVVFSPDSAQMDTGGYSDVAAKLYSDKRRRIQKKIEREQANPEDYAAIDVHNINLIYLHRSLMEDLIDDDATFSDKIAGAFVRIRIPGVGQKQDMYRLVKVLGTRRVREKYNVGKKTTNFALEILNLDKTEVITVDTISNQDFTEEECKRLRQSIKCGLINRLKVGDIHEKAKIFQSVRVNDWLENEKQRLSHLRDRASETGRRKELRECVEKLQLLNTHEERTRRINEVPEVHADPHMDPDYESAEELDDKKAGKDVDQMATRTGSNLLFSGRKGTDSNYVQSHVKKNLDSSHHPSGSMSTESIIHKSGAGSNSGSLHSMIAWENPKPHINVNSTEGKVASLSSSGVSESSDMEPEKVWHYKDPSGNIQGPFTLSQLAKWRSYFPRDMRVWLTFESEENSLLLTELLSKQQKDFIQPTSITASNRSTWASTGQNRSNSNVDQKDILSPVGYSIPNPSGLANHSTNCSAHSAPKRGDLSSSDRRLPSARSAEPLKDAHTLRGQVQHQINYSGIIPSSASLYGQPHLYQGVQGGHFSGWNNGGMWSSTKPQASCSGHSDIEPHPNWHNSGSQSQNDSKSNLQSRSTKDLNSQWTSSQILPAPYPQQIGRDASNIVGASSPSESKTTSGQQEGSCWSSTTNPGTHDELIFSIASAKPNIHAPATPVEDRGSSSPSGLPSQSERATGCSPPQSAPSASVFASKMEETMNQNKTCEPDASNASVNQSPHSKMEQVLSPDIQYLEGEYPSPTPRSERREPSANLSLSTSSENLATKVPDHSQIALASETSGQATCEIGGLQSLTSLEDKYLKFGGPAIQTEELNKGSTGVNRESIVVNPISGAESIAMSDVLEPLPEQSCGTSNMHEPAILEDFTAASAEVEHEPQCSSPIALSPWNESSYYQGEAVDSALWGVQDYPTNEVWSLPSPTPALQPSTGIGTDGKNSSSGIDEVIVGNSDIALGIQIPGEKKMQQADESASTAWRLLEPVKSKPSSTSGPLAEGGTRVLGQQSSAHESSNVNSTWSANQNHNLASSYDTVAPTNKNYLEAPNRQGNIDMYAAREALGNTDKNWNSSAGNANWSSQWSQHHDRYSHGSEHWRGTSIYSRSRSDGFGSGVSSRSSTSRGQSQRGICKFHESGYCRKGASCNYLHP